MGEARTAVLVGPGDGRTIPRPETGGTVVIKVSDELSNGSMTVYESRRSKGDERGPGLHAHAGFDELFFVVAGEYDFHVDGRTLRAAEGSCVFIPRGVWHGFQSTGRRAGRLLTFCSPGGIEHFFEEAARQPERYREMAIQHGLEFARD